MRRLAKLQVDPTLGDWLPVVGLMLIHALDAGVIADQPVGPRITRTLFALVIALPVGFRRRVPLAALTISTIGVALQSFLVSPLLGFNAFVALLIGVYSAAARCTLSRALVGLVVVGAAVTANFLADPSARIEDMVFPVVYFGGAWTLGRFLRIRSRRVDELGELAATLATEQEQRARLAVSEERTRIARELHDIVAHGVSTIVLQAQGAQELMDKDPERARRMLATIQETGRGSLVELRRLLGLLRSDGDAAELDPQPRIEALEGLVERLRAGGMDVSMDLDGDPSSLPAALQLSVYRIAQEALTNSLKYAGPVATHVEIKIGTRTVSVEVADEGKKQIGAMNGGHGLIGIQERVKLFGGDVSYGPRPEGGFALKATIPVAGSET